LLEKWSNSPLLILEQEPTIVKHEKLPLVQKQAKAAQKRLKIELERQEWLKESEAQYERKRKEWKLKKEMERYQ
jgi:hypothetical protein